MKYSEVERKLAKAGCYCLKDGGKHPIWFSPITGKIFLMSRHKKRRSEIWNIKKYRQGFGG